MDDKAVLLRIDKQARGMCVDCGPDVLAVNARYCEYHRKKRNQYLADHRAKKMTAKTIAQKSQRDRQDEESRPSEQSLNKIRSLMGGLI